MATKEPTKTATVKPSYLEPKFTSERWNGGIWNTEYMTLFSTLYIKDDELLSFSQREERETRALVFDYQFKYAQKEYELMAEEFREIEAKLNQQGKDAKKMEHPFKQPLVPEEKKPKKVAKSKSKTSSESESDKEKTPLRKSSRTRTQKETKDKK